MTRSGLASSINGSTTRLVTGPAAAACLAIGAATGLVEWLAGRPPLCRCGTVRLWAGEVHGPENSQQLADWYSLSHLVHGLLFYAAAAVLLRRWRIGWRLVAAVALEAGWELAENSPVIIERYRAATLAWGYEGDSILNSVGDIGFMALGFLFAARAPAWASVLAAVALELAALAAIRDNLLLNILMLVHPLASVRGWQGG